MLPAQRGIHLAAAGQVAFRAPGLYKTGMSQLTDKRKQSLYFPEEMLREIEEEASRLDRSLSWVVQQAWKLARAQMSRMPAINDPAAPGN
jgi:uncharacterized small protein (TIGR04563 family)